ncbi:MAG: helix-turn-helix domain-containing protein [Actinomycetota bacterium]|nr:helix-turn-helix domain-containing protein [Actinomycetota bacterium]
MRVSKTRNGELLLEDREEIRVGIDRDESDSAIGERIGKRRCTVWREIKFNGIVNESR